MSRGSKGPNVGELRARMPATARRRSTPMALGLFGLSALLYVASFALIILAPWWPLKLFFSVANTFFLSILFVIGHDACHGALSPSAWLNAVVGRLCFLPSLHPYAGWEHAHNHIHHGWTNLRQKDYAWAPHSPESYAALPRWRRAMLRFYRSPWGFGAYYFCDVYLRRTIFPTRAFRGRMNLPRFLADCGLVAAFMTAQAAVLILAPRWLPSAGSPAALLFFGQLLPFAIFQSAIGFLIFLHHTHPQIPWFDDQEEWNFYRGQVQGTAHVTFPGPVNWLIHRIMEHTAHHVDPRIPLYRLAEAQASLEAAFPEGIVEHKFSLRSLTYTLRVCRLYDYREHRWLDWNGEPTSSRAITDLHRRPPQSRLQPGAGLG